MVHNMLVGWRSWPGNFGMQTQRFILIIIPTRFRNVRMSSRSAASNPHLVLAEEAGGRTTTTTTMNVLELAVILCVHERFGFSDTRVTARPSDAI